MGHSIGNAQGIREESAPTARPSHDDASSNPRRGPLGGQHTLTLFGVPGFNFREAAAETRATAQQETVISQREAARRETAQRLREFRQALGEKLACAQEQAPPTPVAPARALYGNARPAVAAVSRALRAERECQPKPPTCRFAPGEPLPVLRIAERAANPPRNRATTPASAFKAASGGLTRPQRSAAFSEEAEAEYEAHMAEVAEARSHQLDAEADRYACSFAGAGYTEYLMVIEG